MVRKTSKKSTSTARKVAGTRAAAKPVLLSGGNPQIAKADGDAPVQAYIAAMPGWKRDVGRRLDALIVQTVPSVRKAVRWNSPFYGIEGRGWFLGVHCLSKYVKVAFFRGAALRPLPPVESKQKEVRYLHIHEGDLLDEKLVASWIRQASKQQGEKPPEPAAGEEPPGDKPAGEKPKDTPAEKLAKELTEPQGKLSRSALAIPDSRAQVIAKHMNDLLAAPTAVETPAARPPAPTPTSRARITPLPSRSRPRATTRPTAATADPVRVRLSP